MKVPILVGVGVGVMTIGFVVGADMQEQSYLDAAKVTTPASRLDQIYIGPTDPPRPEHYDIWLRLAECESGGNWQINTGNGYYGGLQFALTSWRAVGGTGYPHQASVYEQMYRAEKLLDLQGWGAWPQCARRLGLR